ncbi:MAG TPA: NrfD/PsrC family molybdoenzyme membrane anchor subunit [Kofleriaceae bacterium]|nr:NrfD/PsrC family molybdoenzyme membrane anchor subunit [Kofleriaceae bacterium]
MSEHPDPGDGRHIDRALGDLHGEAAGIDVRDPDTAWPIAPGITPAIGAPTDAAPTTYYDLPVVKIAPWKAYIPTYFAIGGLAGAAASLAGVLELGARTRSTRALPHTLHAIATLGEAAGAALLIADLGRPTRFHHMLRVFRPTSPMNLGTWILSAASATSALGWLAALRGRRSPPVLSVAGIVSGALLSTYTGVLIGNTAVPLWHATRRAVPPWFAALSVASLGSTLELIAPAHPVTRVYSIAGKTAQLATGLAVASAARTAGVDGPLRPPRGGSRSSALWRTATLLGAAGLVASLWPTRGRRASLLAGALGLASTVLGRFAITEAGRASAADPRATFTPQRAAARP